MAAVGYYAYMLRIVREIMTGMGTAQHQVGTLLLLVVWRLQWMS